MSGDELTTDLDGEAPVTRAEFGALQEEVARLRRRLHWSCGGLIVLAAIVMIGGRMHIDLIKAAFGRIEQLEQSRPAAPAPLPMAIVPEN